MVALLPHLLFGWKGYDPLRMGGRVGELRGGKGGKREKAVSSEGGMEDITEGEKIDNCS